MHRLITLYFNCPLPFKTQNLPHKTKDSLLTFKPSSFKKFIKMFFLIAKLFFNKHFLDGQLKCESKLMSMGYCRTLLIWHGHMVCLQPRCKCLILPRTGPFEWFSSAAHSQTSISLNWLGWSGAGPQNLGTLSSWSESTLYCTEWVWVRVRVGRVTVSGIVCHILLHLSVGRGRCPSAIWSNQPPRGQLPALLTLGVKSAVQPALSSITMACFVT